MLIELMKMITNTGFCPAEWKNAKSSKYSLIPEAQENNFGDEES
jgi:hypothetical protein